MIKKYFCLIIRILLPLGVFPCIYVSHFCIIVLENMDIGRRKHSTKYLNLLTVLKKKTKQKSKVSNVQNRFNDKGRH